jgi:hypothetical protein
MRCVDCGRAGYGERECFRLGYEVGCLNWFPVGCLDIEEEEDDNGSEG